MAASKQPLRTNLTSDLESATLYTLVSILPLLAILLPTEAMAASKRPWRSHLALDLNSVTSITYVLMSLWPLNVNIHKSVYIFPAPPEPLKLCQDEPLTSGLQIGIAKSSHF